MEFLEDRTAPAVLDLTGMASEGIANPFQGAIFTASIPHTSNSGSGNIDSFVRLDNTGIEQGFNTDARPYVSPNDAGTTASFNHSLQLSSLPVVVVNGQTYYEFMLDANQTNNLPYLSLDELRLYVSNSSTLNTYNPTTGQLNGSTAVYDMDGGLDPTDSTYVKLNINLNPGSGQPDLFVDVPTALFGSNLSQYVYLYSKFGVQDLNDQILGGTADAKNGGSANDGYEEWARGIGGPIQSSGLTATKINQVTSAGVLIQSNVTDVPFGSYVQDTATVTPNVTGIGTPTGTVTYYFYNIANPVYGSTNPIATSGPLALVNGIAPNSMIEGPLQTPANSFIAVYSGGPSTDGLHQFVGTVGPVEPLTVEPAGNPSINTIIDQQVTPTTEITGVTDVALGSIVHDSSTITPPVGGGPTPTGTVTYTLVGAGLATLTPSGSWKIVNSNPTTWSETVTISNGLVPETDNTPALPTGSYTFSAVYHSTNPQYNNGTFNSALEPFKVDQGTPTISTVVEDAKSGSSDTALDLVNGAALGTSAQDDATVTPTTSIAFAAGDTVTYYFYNVANPKLSGPTPQGGDTTPFASSTKLLNTDSDPTAALGAGSYSYIAVFNGDANYNAVIGAVEPFTINKGTLSLVTTIHNAADGSAITSGSSVALGTSVYDTSAVTGAVGDFAIGAISYTFNGNAVTSSSSGPDYQTATQGPLGAGDYTFQASLAANANYDVNTIAPESVHVGKATPTLLTTASPGITLDASGAPTITDTAFLSGGNNPTGSITFTLTLNGKPVTLATPTVTVNGDGSYSDSYTLPTTGAVAGTYEWSATYSGDANNNPATEPNLAGSGTVTLGGLNQLVGINSNTLTGTITVSGQQPVGVYLGQFDVTFQDGSGNTSSFFTFCIDPTHEVKVPQTYAVNVLDSLTSPPFVSNANDAAMAYIYEHDGMQDLSNNPDQAAAVAIAMMDLVLDSQPLLTPDSSGGWKSGSGAFDISKIDPSIIALVNTYLAAAQNATTSGAWLDATPAGTDLGRGQSLILPGEQTIVNPANPIISTTQQPASATVGSSIADQATVSGGFNPTGTVTFNLYNNPNGTGPALFTDTETLVGGKATSKSTTTTATGTDYWVATYNGDSNNNAVTSGASDEPVTINPVVDLGLTAGYYKNHTRVWDSLRDPIVQGMVAEGLKPFTTTTTFNSYFGLSYALGETPFSDSTTMLQVLQTGGGGAFALARQSIAALLNGGLDPNYVLPPGITSAQQLYIAIVQAFKTKQYQPLEGQLAADNAL
jgi:hypothetical protein